MQQLLSPTRLVSSLLALSLASVAIACPQGSLGDKSQGQPTFEPQLATTGLVETLDGGFVTDGVAHRARFDDSGALLGVVHPVTQSTEAAVTLRLVDHGRLGHVRTVVGRAPSRATTETVRYEHPGISERYRVDPSGFEQSFVLKQRPAGQGDFVIGIAAHGAGLQLPTTVAKHGALEFCHDGEATIRYGEAIAFERGGKPVPVATRCNGVDRIELIVPGTFLDQANYPVIIDPAVGPLFLPGGSTSSDSVPDVAQHASTGHFMFVWQRQVNVFTELRGRIYRHDGFPLSPVMVLTSSGQAENPSVCGLNGFLVAYEWGDHVRVRKFSANSITPQSGEVQVSFPAQGEQDRRPSISGDGGNQALLVYDRTASGALQPYQVRAASVYYAGQWLSSNGTVLENVTSGYVRNARIPRNMLSRSIGGQWWRVNRVVWERFYTSPSPGDHDLRTAAIRGRNASVVIDDPVETVAGAGSVGPNEYRADIGLQGVSTIDPNPLFLIAWDEDRDVKAHRYGISGSIGTEIDIRSTSDVETSPAVGAGFCEFTVAYLQAIPPNEFSLNVRAARVLPDGTVPISNRPVDVLNGPYQSGLRASSAQLSAPITLRKNTVMLAWQGATGPAPGVNDVRAHRYEPVAPNIAPYGSACPGPGGSLPTIDTNADPVAGLYLFKVEVDNAPPNSLAVLLIGNLLASSPIPGAPGCTRYVGLPLLNALPTVTSVSGSGSIQLPMPCSIPSGVTLAFQWAVYTPGHNAFGWITSDDIDISWSHY